MPEEGPSGRPPSPKRRRLEEAFARRAQAEHIMKRVRAQQRRAAPIDGASDDEEHFAKREAARLQRDIAKLNPITLHPPTAAATGRTANAPGAAPIAGNGQPSSRRPGSQPSEGTHLPTAVQHIYIKAPKGTAKTAAPQVEVAPHSSAVDAVAACSFEDLAGMDDVISQLREMVLLPLQYPEVFSHLGVSPPRGILFHGVPGSGKTLAARALAGECARISPVPVTFYARKGADCLGKFVGEAERTLRLMFQEASRSAPAIIFLDEIDALVPGRAARSGTQDQIHASVVSTLLSLMDGMTERGNVVVVASTNRPESIDAALRRPGRFDREVYFGLPDPEQRAAILRAHTRRWDFPPASELVERIAAATEGYAGADLAALCTSAVMHAVRRAAPELIERTEALADGREESTLGNINNRRIQHPEAVLDLDNNKDGGALQRGEATKGHDNENGAAAAEVDVLGRNKGDHDGTDIAAGAAPSVRPPLPEIVIESSDWDAALAAAPAPCSRRESTHALAADLARPLAHHIAPLLVPSLRHVLHALGKSSLPLPVAVRQATQAAAEIELEGEATLVESRGEVSTDARSLTSDAMGKFEATLTRLGAVQHSPQQLLYRSEPTTTVPTPLPSTPANLSEVPRATTTPSSGGADPQRPRHQLDIPWSGLSGISVAHPPLRLLISGCGDSGQHEVAGAVLRLFGGSHVTVLSLPAIAAEGAGDATGGALALARAALQRADPHSAMVIHLPRIETWAVAEAVSIMPEEEILPEGQRSEQEPPLRGTEGLFSLQNPRKAAPDAVSLHTVDRGATTAHTGPVSNTNTFSPSGTARPFDGLSSLALRVGVQHEASRGHHPSQDTTIACMASTGATPGGIPGQKESSSLSKPATAVADHASSIVIDSDAWVAFDALIREAAPRQPLVLLATTSSPSSALSSSVLSGFEASGGVVEVNVDAQHGNGNGKGSAAEEDEELEEALIRVGEVAKMAMAVHAAAAFADRLRAGVQEPQREQQDTGQRNNSGGNLEGRTEQQLPLIAETARGGDSTSGVHFRQHGGDVGDANIPAAAALPAAAPAVSLLELKQKLKEALNDAEWQKSQDLYSSVQRFLVELGTALVRDRRCKAASALFPRGGQGYSTVSLHDVVLAAANGYYLSLEQLQGAVERVVKAITWAAEEEERTGDELLRHPHAVALAHAVQDSIDAACHALRAALELDDPTHARLLNVVTRIAEEIKTTTTQFSAQEAAVAAATAREAAAAAAAMAEAEVVTVEVEEEEMEIELPLVEKEVDQENADALHQPEPVKSSDLADIDAPLDHIPALGTGSNVALIGRSEEALLGTLLSGAATETATRTTIATATADLSSFPSMQLDVGIPERISSGPGLDDAAMDIEGFGVGGATNTAQGALLLESIQQAAAEVEAELLQRAHLKEAAMDFTFSASLRDCALWRAVNEALPALMGRGMAACEIALSTLPTVIDSTEEIAELRDLFVSTLLEELNKC